MRKSRIVSKQLKKKENESRSQQTVRLTVLSHGGQDVSKKIFKKHLKKKQRKNGAKEEKEGGKEERYQNHHCSPSQNQDKPPHNFEFDHKRGWSPFDYIFHNLL